MTPTEVRATETGIFVTALDENCLAFQAELVGFPCSIHYEFTPHGELCCGTYFFDSPDDRLDAVTFNRLHELLNRKYGEGDFQEHWKSYRRVSIETIGDLGQAVAAGLLNVSVRWSTPEADILLALGDDEKAYEAHVILSYSDPDQPELGDTTAADFDMI